MVNCHEKPQKKSVMIKKRCSGLKDIQERSRPKTNVLGNSWSRIYFGYDTNLTKVFWSD